MEVEQSPKTTNTSAEVRHLSAGPVSSPTDAERGAPSTLIQEGQKVQPQKELPSPMRSAGFREQDIRPPGAPVSSRFSTALRGGAEISLGIWLSLAV